MSPLRPHRRSRRRPRSGQATLLFCVAVLLALLVGGLTQVGRQSGPFDSSVNRSFVAQESLVAAQSNATGSSLRHLMGAMEAQDRQSLQADLDALVTEADRESARTGVAEVTAASGGIQGEVLTAFTVRADAVAQLRAAIDGLLDMHPLAVDGAPASPPVAAAPATLSSTGATDDIAAAGRLLLRADRTYAAARAALARLAGHALLPASKWVTDPNLWQLGALATQVDLVESSESLAATHRVVLSVVKLTPPALPTASGAPAATSILPPTSTIAVDVVLSNLGAVDEPRAAVRVTITPLLSGRASTATRTAAVAAGSAASLATAAFPVRPGTVYQLMVAIAVPAGQTALTGTSLTQTLQIAPGT